MLRRAGRDGSRLSVRPTSAGWQVLAAGALVFFVARLIGTTQFHQLAYALLALPFASLVLGIAGSRGVRFSRSVPPGTHLTAGETSAVVLELSRTRFGASRAEVVDRLPEPRTLKFPPPRGGNRTAVLEAPLSFPRRGVYELGPAETRISDPFGLLGFSRTFREKTEVVVYPKTYPLPGFPLRGGDMEAGSRGSRGQRGDEFASLREYRRGDDRRHIHWKSVARTGELFVKEFSLEAPRRHTVVLDARREGIRTNEGEVEDAVSAAASVLRHLSRERLPLRLLCANAAAQATEFGNDDAPYRESMRLLAQVRADGARHLSEVVLEGRGGLGEGVVIVSRTRDAGLPAAVRSLRDAGLSVVVVALATYTYRTPPGSGGAAQGRGEEFARSLRLLEAAGATVRVVDQPNGVGGLSGGRRSARAGSNG
ncbi:DUF58 domain-containing protein [Rubrobacter tropicus]|uniref:DUF58 domain-containing protein n=1 Tax=Rubrobacter tropicus TaxID=2653851 RepID=A0A6G8Q5A5_9ACTN|nr:DUF58 domain-containing protein [Rubrobacter tropicus]QIN81623.1 DUF58 domain-containing protein [Rubrobacter tropicus]